MAETRAGRLARLAAELEDQGGWGLDDMRWLLAQVPDVEYRLEWFRGGDRWTGLEDAGSLEDARERLAHYQAFDDGTYRVSSSPVQQWTPVEEEQA